jgi:hypothetical protein
MIVIDTSVWLFALRKNYHPTIKDIVNRLLVEEEVAINGLIKLELLGGTRTENEYKRLKSRLDSLYYIESTESLWEEAALLAFILRRKGITVPFTDVFIATSAIIHKAMLVHADRHFDLIKKHTELRTKSLVSLVM